MRHAFVYRASERFAGWPANNGVWCWGNEILVGFNVGHFKDNQEGHSIDRDKPSRAVLARSTDGGETWTIEEPDTYAWEDVDAKPCPGEINFAAAGFAMKCRNAKFLASCDRGKTWEGPFRFPDLVPAKLTSRTDYVVNGRDECLMFLSAQEPRVEARLQDRAFCARTTDGGKTWQFQGWMTGEPIAVRSVMPSTVRVSANRLVSALRRREKRADRDRNFIDAYGSSDDGATWQLLAQVASTDDGAHNGNPPSLVRLTDGRLCATYGYRAQPYGIRARISRDGGKTWGDEIILRNDGRTWDLGYTRTVARTDGRLVTIYYFTTAEDPHQHIVATIWDPDRANAQSA